MEPARPRRLGAGTTGSRRCRDGSRGAASSTRPGTQAGRRRCPRAAELAGAAIAGCPRERPIGKDDKMTTSTPSIEAVLAVFAAVEQRDNDALARVCQPDVEFCWPPSLPYGGTARGFAERGGGG